MILGIGTDIASVARIAEALEEQGERFLARCFAEEERARVESAAQDDAARRAGGYARRWAAKEACAKALGLGIQGGVFLKDIKVLNDADGRPALALSGGAKERLTRITPEGMTPVMHISLSDDAGAAVAFVVISAERDPHS